MEYTGRISKHGDGPLRSLLYEAANVLLTIVRKAHPTKDRARRIRKRSSHKKACVVLARKLAVIMHRMLVNGEMFRWPAREAATRLTHRGPASALACPSLCEDMSAWRLNAPKPAMSSTHRELV